jgi:hypothetical protein
LITVLGENLDGFARRAFQSAVSYGISWVLVDASPPPRSRR